MELIQIQNKVPPLAKPIMVQNLAREVGKAATPKPTPHTMTKAASGAIGGFMKQLLTPISNVTKSNGVQAAFPGLGTSSDNTIKPAQANPASMTQTAPIQAPSTQMSGTQSSGTQAPQTAQVRPATSLPTASNANQNAGYYGIERTQAPAASYTSATPTPQAGLIQSLLGLQGKVQPEVQNVAGQIRDLRTGLSNALYQNNTQAIPLEFMTGRAQALQNQEAQRESALTGYLGDLLKGYDSSAGMLGTAISASAPLAGNALGYVTPTGQPIGDTQSQGYTGLRNYSIAQNNIALGGDNQKAAQATASAIQNYRQGLDGLTKFMQANGINQQNIPAFNGPIRNWLSTIGNPGAGAAFNAYINDLQNFAGALIQQGVDLTPTGTEGQMLLTDPSNLSVDQLMTLGKVLDQLGMIRYTTAATQAQGAYNSATQPGSFYTGGMTPGYDTSPVVGTPNTNVAGFNPQNADPLAQWLGGAGMGAAANAGYGVSALGGAAATKIAEFLFR